MREENKILENEKTIVIQLSFNFLCSAKCLYLEEAHKSKRFTTETPGKSQESEATCLTKGIHGNWRWDCYKKGY